MQKEDNQSQQSQRYEKPELQPIEDVLNQLGYPLQVIENYSRLSQKDMHLAEIYRLDTTDVRTMKKFINPLQTRVDRKGRIWIDIMLEKKKGVRLSELKKIMKIHGKPGRGRFVSGRIQAADLPQLIDKAVQLQTARPLYPTLYRSVPSIKADKGTLSQLLLPATPDGHGVIVGIVDIDGCDFRHPNFIKNNKSRLLCLWDQNGKSGNGKPRPKKYDYGVEYSQDRINAALGENDPYADLGYRPDDEAHGTHVMDIAAGSSSQYPGVAPGADLIFVHLGTPTNPRDEELKNMGSSKCLLDAVQYIFEKAEELAKHTNTPDTPIPAVVNISIAGNGGSHDGTSTIESAFDDLLKTGGRAIAIAAGNTYHKELHTSGTIEPNSAPYEIQWLIEDSKKSQWDLRQELEIWYDKNARLTVEVLDPNNKSYGECPLGEIETTLSADSQIPPVLIRHDKPDSEPGEDENHINIFIANDNPNNKIGTWKIRLSLDTSLPGNNTKVDFHAWIEYFGSSHSHFPGMPEQPEYTINTIGNGVLPIVVGSYDPRSNSLETSSFSSAGPSRNKKNTKKPDFCAPGEYIFAARATDPSGGGTLKDGTSQAAPHVTGLIALMFQVAKEHQNSPKILSIQDIRKTLLDSVDPKPMVGSTAKHDPHSGFGRVNAFDTLSKILHH
jgi:subtilisin family serine protease